jgi:hypothetical protein
VVLSSVAAPAWWSVSREPPFSIIEFTFPEETGEGMGEDGGENVNELKRMGGIKSFSLSVASKAEESEGGQSHTQRFRL